MITVQFNIKISYLAEIVVLLWITINFFLFIGFALSAVEIGSAILGQNILHTHIDFVVSVECASSRTSHLTTLVSDSF